MLSLYTELNYNIVTGDSYPSQDIQLCRIIMVGLFNRRVAVINKAKVTIRI